MREVRERRDQLQHPHFVNAGAAGHPTEPIMELGYHQTTGAGEMDILLLYSILDIFNRYSVGS